MILLGCAIDQGTVDDKAFVILYLKGHGNEPDFPRFLLKSVRHRSLTLHFDFGFELSEIFVFEKRLPDSTIRGVDDSPHH